MIEGNDWFIHIKPTPTIINNVIKIITKTWPNSYVEMEVNPTYGKLQQVIVNPNEYATNAHYFVFKNKTHADIADSQGQIPGVAMIYIIAEDYITIVYDDLDKKIVAAIKQYLYWAKVTKWGRQITNVFFESINVRKR